MFERLKDELVEEDEDGGLNRDGVDKYMKDLTQMMDGMLDLNRRNQLPDRERAICLKLLLRITLKVGGASLTLTSLLLLWLSSLLLLASLLLLLFCPFVLLFVHSFFYSFDCFFLLFFDRLFARRPVVGLGLVVVVVAGGGRRMCSTRWSATRRRSGWRPLRAPAVDATDRCAIGMGRGQGQGVT